MIGTDRGREKEVHNTLFLKEKGEYCDDIHSSQSLEYNIYIKNNIARQ